MKTIKVIYHADTLETTITIDGETFDTSRINGKEIADWAYPFMMRKVKWNGFYDEMAEASGEKEFNLIFEGSEADLNELKEAWEDAPVHIITENSDTPDVVVEYDEKNLTTKITVKGEEFDTSRINGKEIEDWVYPFMMRKVKWNGIFEELSAVIGSDEYILEFSGNEKQLDILNENCPETVTIRYNPKTNSDKNEDDEEVFICYRYDENREFFSENNSNNDEEYSQNDSEDEFVNNDVYDLDEDDDDEYDDEDDEYDDDDEDEYDEEDDEDDDEDDDDGEEEQTEESILRLIACQIDTDCLKEIINFFVNYSSSQIENYETLSNYINQFFDLRYKSAECSPDYETVQEFINIFSNKFEGNHMIIQPLIWFLNILKVISENKPDKFQDTISYINSVIPRLENLISELEEDFDKNCDKIFEFLEEMDENSPYELVENSQKKKYIVSDVMDYSFSLEDAKNNAKLDSINSKDKKKDAGLIAGSAVAGGLLSFIPIVGIPLALGASTFAGKVLADDTNLEFDIEFKRFSNEINTFFYNYIIIYIIWLFFPQLLNECMSNAEEYAGLNNIGFDESDDFFDKINDDFLI